MVVDPDDEVLDGFHLLFDDPTIVVGLLRHVCHVEEVHHVVHLSGDEEVEQDLSQQHLSPKTVSNRTGCAQCSDDHQGPGRNLEPSTVSIS